MASEYYLMNKDDRLLRFKIEKKWSDEVCVEVSSYSKRRPIGFIDIDTWVENRNYAKHKEHLSRWLKEWQINTAEGFVEMTHCLSLNDCLWVKPVSSTLCWADVNLYENEFSDISERTAFEKGLYGLRLTSTSPEFTSEGSFAKCWKRRDRTVHLIKKGSEGFANSGLEPYSEYYAAQLAKKICRDTVSYDLEMFKGSLCSSCELFTSQEFGFVPFYRILKDNRRQTLSSVMQICSELGFEDEFRRMIITDSITFNPDRHVGNFGFLVDNETFEIKSFAPIFDFNMALMCRAMEEDITQEDPLKYIREYSQGHKLGGEYIEVAKAMMTSEIRCEMNKLKGNTLVRHERYNLPVERLAVLNKAVEITCDSVFGKEIKRYRGR